MVPMTWASRNATRRTSMVKTVMKLVSGITLFGMLATLLPLKAQDHQTRTAKVHYIVTSLGTLGGTLSTAEGINNRGLVTGAANLAGDQNEHAFSWYRGQIFD